MGRSLTHYLKNRSKNSPVWRSIIVIDQTTSISARAPRGRRRPRPWPGLTCRFRWWRIPTRPRCWPTSALWCWRDGSGRHCRGTITSRARTVATTVVTAWAAWYRRAPPASVSAQKRKHYLGHTSPKDYWNWHNQPWRGSSSWTAPITQRGIPSVAITVYIHQDQDPIQSQKWKNKNSRDLLIYRSRSFL